MSHKNTNIKTSCKREKAYKNCHKNTTYHWVIWNDRFMLQELRWQGKLKNKVTASTLFRQRKSWAAAIFVYTRLTDHSCRIPLICNNMFCCGTSWSRRWQYALQQCCKTSWRKMLPDLYVNLPFERLFVTFWKFIRSHAVTPRWLDDTEEFIQSEWGKQRDSCSLAHKILAADAGRFESRISRKLFGS